MRTAFNGDFIGDASRVMGICLGGDHVAEHERGIAPLKRAFGLDETKLGLEKFRCRSFPEPVVMSGIVDKKRSMLVLLDVYHQNCLQRNAQQARNLRAMAANYRLLPYSDKPFVAAWDDHSFGILASGKESVQRLTAVLKAWEDHDLCLVLEAPSNPFSPAGLCFIQASSYSQEERDALEQADLEQQRLLKAAGKTKITEKLKKAGLGYYALEPRWKDFFKDPVYQSKYPVVFYLNPEGQDKYNSGWFTVEELLQWIHGKGPVIKSVE